MVTDIGMNAVAIFIYHDSIKSHNLLDLLRRIDALGLKVNLSLRPGTPMHFHWKEVRELLEYYRIKEHDCIFALDLAWEPMFGNHTKRKQWDQRWREWVIERYGSIKNAENDWAFAAPRDNAGKLTNPHNHQTIKDGQWRRMVAAYRRFLDTLLYEKYSQARRLVHSIDPNHMVSFRMADAGNPTSCFDQAIPYDFPYLSAAVDILEPEAYGRIGNWEQVKPGWFEFEYARWAAPDKPMMWAEVGVSTWTRSLMVTSPSQLQFQADYYSNFYRMMTSSGADGVFFWWYPGGYRFDERSDYGIINPDGSDRPVTKVIRKAGKAFLNGPPAKPIDYWIEIDRDRYPAGVAGIYKSVRREFWNAIESGRVPGLKTAATGTNSANCPLLSVGNTPYNKSDPHKFLDGFFDVVEVRNAAGKWVEVKEGGTVKANWNAPVIARLTLTNLGEPLWLSPNTHQGTGAVYVLVDGPELVRNALPESVPHSGTLTVNDVILMKKGLHKPAEITLKLQAEGRADFGPCYTFTLSP